jgi:proteasome lid subunit RPN8/RPN11
MRMSKAVHTEIIFSICCRPPETGGLLLGPIDSNNITDFFYDQGANCTGATYTPDHITLRRKMKEEWIPSGIDMKGFVHSHPGRFDCLSLGDLEYISRLLIKNEDMDIFFAPIIIPSEYRIRPLAVLRNNPKVSVEAKLVLL